MSEDVAERIGAQVENLDDDENKVFHLIGGNTLEALGKVVAAWCSNGKP